MAGSDVGFQDCDFVLKVIGDRGKSAVVGRDGLRVLGALEEVIGGGFLGM